ncbi:uncharacterized protein HMPREF1541_09854 [Cyphellophora europaea CBS 101466]|uniref:Xylanolytic transcriptional activator regulatory domain-containing protein n=1 Tax=Cyphellophora europaea (strain CBS 101466) TaxID=1220924 RepID=W2SAD5_CYPE1|nr:uncharacterized protein HMPREF1541_09854 [Cyphellophora europaea CBS 101466]ETN44978.1 hypothetical protein HMPREF1541_09854 [Cyphellophora europaea CBS 101466]
MSPSRPSTLRRPQTRSAAGHPTTSPTETNSRSTSGLPGNVLDSARGDRDNVPILPTGNNPGARPSIVRLHDSATEPTPGYSIVGGNGTLDETEDDNVHVVGPVLANDNEVLEPYLSAIPEAGRYRKSICTDSSRMARPVLFTTMSRRPLGVTKNQTLSAAKCEVIEKLLEPHCQAIVQRYLEQANICMPMFDAAQLLDVYTNEKEKISPALLANLYANALIYWRVSPTALLPTDSLSKCPDGRFVWVQAHEALHSETFLAPGISTVMALLLNIGGRPSTSPFNNAGMMGTAVALAHALGLNRDPSKWQLHNAEKDMRVRIWWQVVLQDRWCSLSYGTPPQIRSSQYDVALPTIEAVSARPEGLPSATIYITLLTLTEELGYLLEHVYDLRSSPSTVTVDGSTDVLERRLGSWKDQLSGDMRAIVLRGMRLEIAGAANLRLAYLATELLLCRISLDLDKETTDSQLAGNYHHIRARRAAEDIVNFIHSLKETHICGFWMPQHGASLTSATAFILRVAVRSISAGDYVDGNASLNMAIRMMGTLRHFQEIFRWDIADHCIAQYGELVDRMASMRHIGDSTQNSHRASMMSTTDSFVAHSIDLPSLELDSMFPSLWDMFEA